MIRLVCWDWNGTLLADTIAVTEAGNHQIKKYGGKPLPGKEYAARFFFPAHEFYRSLGSIIPQSEKGQTLMGIMSQELPNAGHVEGQGKFSPG